MNDDRLRSLFKKLRDDEIRHAPAFNSVLGAAPTSRPHRTALALRWSLGLATFAAAIALAIIQPWKKPGTAPFTIAVTHPEPAETPDLWTVPSDSVLTEQPSPRNLATAERLIGEIDQLLKS